MRTHWIIEDPINLENNVARNIRETGAREIVNEFAIAVQAMEHGQSWNAVMAPVTRGTQSRKKRKLPQKSSYPAFKRQRVALEPPIPLRPPIH